MFNVSRVGPAPASLSNQRGYRDADVVLRLSEIFFDKCYICELKSPTSMNVEHFNPHMGDIAKQHDWNNLFYVCARCNNIKLAGYLNLLDCTDSSVDVCTALRHVPPPTPYQAKLVIEAMHNDVKTIETARLLNEVFNSSKTINKILTATYLRKKVFEKYNRFLSLVNRYFDEELPDADRDDALVRLGGLVSKKQEFSAFIRWIVKEDDKLRDLLQPYFD